MKFTLDSLEKWITRYYWPVIHLNRLAFTLPGKKFVLLSCLLTGFATNAFSQKRIHHIGPPSRQSFSAPVRSKPALEQMLKDKSDDIAAILRSRYPDWRQVSDALIQAASSATEIDIEPGTEHPWMAMRSHGRPTSRGPWIWAGKDAFKAWTFTFKVLGTNTTTTWTVFVPQPCGNFWLTEINKETVLPHTDTSISLHGDMKITAGPISIDAAPTTIQGGNITINGGDITINAKAITITGPVTAPPVITPPPPPSSCLQCCCRGVFKLFGFIPIGSYGGCHNQQHQEQQQQGNGEKRSIKKSATSITTQGISSTGGSTTGVPTKAQCCCCC